MKAVILVAAILFLPLAAAHTSFDFDDGLLPEVEVEPGNGEINELIFLPFIWLAIAMMYYLFGQERMSRSDVEIEEEGTIEEGEIVEAGWGEKGFSLTTNWNFKAITLCALYVAQGIPSGFISYTLLSYLAERGYTAAEIGEIIFWVYLPWVFKFLWGPFVDNYHYLPMGRRRPWILGAQAGMVLTLLVIVLIPSIEDKIFLLTLMLFCHNLFASLQDVAVDGLAVDILKADEFGKINGFMFGAKRGGIMLGGAGIGIILGREWVGISGALFLMVPMLLLIMCLPLMIRERPGEKLLPWKEGKAVLKTDDDPETLKVEKSVDENYIRAELTQKNVTKAILVDVALLIALFLFLKLSVGGREVIGLPLEILLSLAVALIYAASLYRGPKDEWNSIGMQFYSLAPQQNDIVKVLSLRAPLTCVLLAMLTYFWEFLIPILNVMFIQDLGWTDTEYVKVTGGLAVASAMVGSICGGLIADKYGARRVASLFCVLTGLSIFTMALAEPFWGNRTIMTFLLVLYPMLGGAMGISLFSLFMNVTWPKVGATQFTLYMAMLNFGGLFGAKMAGYFEANFTYTSTIMIGGTCQLFIAFILPYIDPGETRRTLGEEF